MTGQGAELPGQETLFASWEALAKVSEGARCFESAGRYENG